MDISLVPARIPAALTQRLITTAGRDGANGSIIPPGVLTGNVSSSKTNLSSNTHAKLVMARMGKAAKMRQAQTQAALVMKSRSF